MDNFAEQIVKKQLSGSEKLKRVVIIAAGVIMILLLVGFSFLMLGQGFTSFVGLLLAAATGYGTFFIVQNMEIEYEYTFTNGELDIDKIIAKKKRKELVSVSVGKFTAFGKYDDNVPEETDDMTVVLASNNIASGEYYADLNHDAYGSTRIIFCPEGKMLEQIKKSLPRALKAKMDE